MSFFAIVFTFFKNSDIIPLNVIFLVKKEELFLQNQKDWLETAIRNKREQMISHAKNNGLLDEGTLNLSRQLDQLILKHIRMKYSITNY